VRHPLRSIAVRWVLLVLAALVLPLLGFALFMRAQLQERHWSSVEYYLLTMAQEMSERLDALVAERLGDVQAWASINPQAEWALDARDDAESPFPMQLQRQFERFVERGEHFELIVAVDAEGRLLAAGARGPGGGPAQEAALERLRSRDYSREPWFEAAMRGESALVDHHASPLLSNEFDAVGRAHLGFAAPVRRRGDGAVVGVVYALMDFARVQAVVLRPVKPSIPLRTRDDLYASTYAWLWKSDCDTILAHPSRELDGRSVSAAPISLPQLVEAARGAQHGLYPRYEFRGVERSAAFRHCRPASEGGFGWVVGVGMDDEDIAATLDELQAVLLKATLVVVLFVVLGTMLVARRTTAPILRLQQAVRRVAAGDLAARSGVAGDDEIGDLGRAFDEMTSEIDESRRKLVKAEKDRAWREMARQVAHEIKNPLTPIQLSMNLLKRARDERSPEFPGIFDRTIELVLRQVDHMRKIAADFSAFAGSRAARPEPLDAASLAGEVLDLNAAWAAESGVELVRELEPATVRADAHELRRVLINLVQNAIEAMPSGGRLVARVRVEREAGLARVLVEFEDAGTGLTETARARLFEPYFTTRSHGTGLGLAIARRLVEEMNGTIELAPRAGSETGTVARVRLPLCEEPASAGGARP
jgi:signal transduction histidine kinase